jgi:tellurite resistance protein
MDIFFLVVFIGLILYAVGRIAFTALAFALYPIAALISKASDKVSDETKENIAIVLGAVFSLAMVFLLAHWDLL